MRHVTEFGVHSQSPSWDETQSSPGGEAREGPMTTQHLSEGLSLGR